MNEPDLRVRLEAWTVNSALPPQVEYFAPDNASGAIDRARYLSQVRTDLRTVIVIDAWNMRLAEFTPTWLYHPLRDQP